MKKTLIWEVISNLSVKEKGAFLNYISSPYFNTRSDLVLLAEIIVGEEELPGREIVFSMVFPDEAYDDQKFRLHLSYLNKHIHQFILLQELKKDVFLKEQLLLKGYSERNMPRNFSKELKRAITKIEAQPLRHPEYYEKRHKIEVFRNGFLAHKGRIKEIDFSDSEYLFNVYFLSAKLRQFIAAISQQVVYNTAYQSEFFDSILQLAQQEPYRDNQTISFYIRLINLFVTGRERDFEELKEQLFKLTRIFPPDEAQELYFMVLNYCVRKINENSRYYNQEAFELYQLGLDSGLLLINNQISKFTFNNIVVIGIKEDQTPWVKRFVENYKHHLSKNDFLATYSINKARLAFEAGKYKQALQLLQDADYEDIITGMNAKVIQMKVYFELDDWEVLDNHLKTMKSYARRKQKYAYHYSFWSKLINYVQKIIRLRPSDKKAAQRLRQAINRHEKLPEKEWLLEQLS